MVYQFLFCGVFSESVSQETCLTVCKWELPYKVFRADFMKPIFSVTHRQQEIKQAKREEMK